MIRHYFIIETMDGQIFNTRDYGIKIIDISVPSVEFAEETETVPGRPGAVDLGAHATREPISIEFDFLARDLTDYPLLRNVIFRLFCHREPFYWTESRELGKRYKVRSRGFTPRQILTKGRTTIQLACNDVYAESRLRSTDDWVIDSDKLQFGMGLSGQYNPVWRYNTSRFTVYNPGDIAINPNYHDLWIVIKAASNGLIIRNRTTGDEVRYSGMTTASDILRLEPGCRVTKNSLSVLGQVTAGAYITLAPGPNQIELLNISSVVEVIVDTRFYYF